MKIKNKNLMIISIFLALINTEKTDYEKYKKLKIYDVPSIKKSDLPSEFCENAFRLVDEFIRKTIHLDYEILILFDFITGEIVKCKIGSGDNVKLKFNDEEFKGKNIASLHNHPKKSFAPPSGKNFGIFLRNWEKFELIAGHDELWILEGRYVDKELTKELQEESMKLFVSSLNYCLKKFSNQKEIDKRCDYLYGARLSNYINDKNINGIQITKKEYNHEPKK